MSIQLSNTQRSIVEAGDGHYLVIAAAGSGKTRVLTERVRHLLQVRKIRSRVLALTFTNKAAEEMRHRLWDLPDLASRSYIGTIHGFCQAIIESYGNALGFEMPPTIIERESDRIAMIEEVFSQNPELRTLLARHSTPGERRKFLYDILEKFSACKRDSKKFEAITNGDWPNETESQAFREYQDHLASQRVIDFDDILLLAHRILNERPAIASIYHRTYQYLCVDEAQDLNAVQYSLLRVLGEQTKSVLLVGDPNQAIYGFNGSSKRFMLKDFPRDFNAQRIDLRENYRSSRAVIRAANALYEGSMDLESAAVEGMLHIETCADEEAEARWVITKVEELVASSPHPEVDTTITLERIAVLARNRYVFEPLQRLLTNHQLDHHLRQPGGISLESELGRVFDLGVRLLVNPRDRLHFRELMRRVGATTPSKIVPQQPLEILESVGARAADSWKHRLQVLLEAWRTLHANVNGFGRALDSLEGCVSAIGRDASAELEEQALALADVGFLREVWKNYAKRVGKENRSLGQFRNQMATGETVPNAEGKGLTLSSIHAVKGLEFDIVFLMGLVEGGFPDYRAVRTGGAALAEEKNDAFVALTRAKRFLFLTWPQTKFMPWDKDNRVAQRKSRFVEEIENKVSLPPEPAIAFRVAEDGTRYP